MWYSNWFRVIFGGLMFFLFCFLKRNVFPHAIYPPSFVSLLTYSWSYGGWVGEGIFLSYFWFLRDGMLFFSVGSNLWPRTSQGHDSSCLHGGSVGRCSCVWQHFRPFWKKDLVLYQHWIPCKYWLFSSVINMKTNLVPRVKRRETLETRF